MAPINWPQTACRLICHHCLRKPLAPARTVQPWSPASPAAVPSSWCPHIPLCPSAGLGFSSTLLGSLWEEGQKEGGLGSRVGKETRKEEGRDQGARPGRGGTMDTKRRWLGGCGGSRHEVGEGLNVAGRTQQQGAGLGACSSREPGDRSSR